MAINSDVSSASAVLSMSCSALGIPPQTIQQFETDKMWSFEPVQITESRMGADGRLIYGVIFNEQKMTVTLQPNSDSIGFFRDIAQAMKHQRIPFRLDGSLILQSIDTIFTLTNGTLQTIPPGPTGQKTLQATDWIIVWESVDPQPL